MSQENVEIARQACEAAWHTPKRDYDTLSVVAHPDAEMFTVQSLVEAAVIAARQQRCRHRASENPSGPCAQCHPLPSGAAA